MSADKPSFRLNLDACPDIEAAFWGPGWDADVADNIGDSLDCRLFEMAEEAFEVSLIRCL